jgi:hypothetical protein
MDKMADHATMTAEPRAHSNTPPRAIRPEILEVFRRGDGATTIATESDRTIKTRLTD